jgi:hypothetical protein
LVIVCKALGNGEFESFLGNVELKSGVVKNGCWVSEPGKSVPPVTGVGM